MVVAQGGEPAAFDDSRCLPQAALRVPFVASSDGYLQQLDALTVANASIALGAGRERKGDPVDLAVGIELEAKVGSSVRKGDPIAIIHANDAGRADAAKRLLEQAISISATHVEPPPLILERLTA